MKHIIIYASFFLITAVSFGQGLIKIGDKAPKYYFIKIVNSTKTTLDISDLKGKATILAFWGTWCGPCVPEMINLGKLQKEFGDKVQIVGVSNDNEKKLKFFLKKRPSKIWFASDPTNNLWNTFDFQTAGHSVLIDKNNKVVGITETDKINSSVLKNLIASNQLDIPEDRGTKRLTENQDPFKLDSTTLYSFVLQPEIKGITPMMKKPRFGTFKNRRITIINLIPEIIFREAYDISISQKLVYPTREDSLKSNQNSYCIDFVVPDNDEIRIKTLFQNELNKHLPFNAAIKNKVIPCYVLRQIAGKQILIKQSTHSGMGSSFDGLAFTGEGILIKSFVAYLENELEYPIYDGTGLTKYYDIHFTKNNIDPLKSVKESLAKMGFELVKDHKEMNVLVINAR